MTPARAARRYGTLLGVAAGLVSLMQVLIAASFATSSQPSVLSVQHALASYKTGAGADFEPFLGGLGAMFVFTYLTAGVSFLLALGFCWYAGRLTGALTRDPRAGAAAGRRVILLASGVWAAGMLLAAVVFHADGNFAWAIATLALVVATPNGRAPAGIYVTHPGGAFVAIQVIMLLFQVGGGLLLAVGGATLAGRRGATGGLRQPNLARRPWWLGVIG